MQGLKEWIERIQISQTQLAILMKMPIVTLNNYVRGTRKMPLEVAEKIAKKTNAKIQISGGNIVFFPADRRRKAARK